MVVMFTFLISIRNSGFSSSSVDLLFTSVVASYKNRAIAVVLTEKGCNKALGVKAIHKISGIVIL
jgi:two-component system, chemotaxis family, protein-glutamate methylesterase/glutaminase